MKTKGRRQSKNVEDKRGKGDRLKHSSLLDRNWTNAGKKTPFRKKMTGISESDMDAAWGRDRMSVKNKNPFASKVSPKVVDQINKAYPKKRKKK